MSSTFSPSELALSLKEEAAQALIEGFELLPVAQGLDQAEADVRLLEGRTLRVQLTPRGFSVRTLTYAAGALAR